MQGHNNFLVPTKNIYFQKNTRKSLSVKCVALHSYIQSLRDISEVTRAWSQV